MRYCKRACQLRSYRRSLISSGEVWKIPSLAVGVISELRAIADLTAKGYEVYRAMNGTAKCDLVAVKKRKKILIEVGSGEETLSGRGIFKKRHNKDNYSDVSAIVFPSYVGYYPPLSGS